jgi:enolase
MTKISSLHARQILDSRGVPTVEVECVLDDGSFGRACVPSGASTGSHEALELRDGNKEVYLGKSVLKAVVNVNETIAKAVKGQVIKNQRAIDTMLCKLDGTENKSVLGANAILGVSMAYARAKALSAEMDLWEYLAAEFGVKNPHILPVPMMNVLNGGKHADSGLSFQECMIVPTKFDTFAEALRAGAEVFGTLKNILSKKGLSTSVGDEGGFAPHLKTGAEAFELLMEAIKGAGYEGKVQLAIDCAASEFFADGMYTIDGTKKDSTELTKYYEDLVRKFPIVSIEDSHSEDDWEGFQAMQKDLGKNIQLVGDDLFVTNVKRIQLGIEKQAANAVLIKLNQIGSVSETVDAIQLTQKQGWHAIVSHRSGETEDTFIAHLAVGLGTGQIKTGSLSRTDRICKYNELLRIEEKLGKKAVYGM